MKFDNISFWDGKENVTKCFCGRGRALEDTPRAGSTLHSHQNDTRDPCNAGRCRGRCGEDTRKPEHLAAANGALREPRGLPGGRRAPLAESWVIWAQTNNDSEGLCPTE